MSLSSTIKRALISAIQDLPFFLLIYEVLNYWLIAIHLSYLKSNLSFTALSNIQYYWNLTVNETGLFVLSVQFSLVTQLCPIICDPMNRSRPGLPVHHQLPELTQTHVHRVGDAIQPSHSLLSPSPPAPNPSEHQGLFQMSRLFTSGGQSIEVSALASVLPKKSQGWSPSEWTGWISLQSKGLSRVFSHTTVQKYQFFGAQLSSQSNSHIHTWPL